MRRGTTVVVHKGPRGYVQMRGIRPQVAPGVRSGGVGFGRAGRFGVGETLDSGAGE